MTTLSDKKDFGENEIDLLKVLSGFKPVFSKYWYVVIGVPLLCAVLGALLSKIPAPKWEAAAYVQLGRISRSELIEPVSNVILRLNSAAFKAGVLEECGIPAGSAAAELYNSTVLAEVGASSSLVEIRAKGLSREAAMKLAATTAGRLESIHAAKILPVLENLKKSRAELGSVNRRGISGGGQPPILGDSLAEMFSLYFVNLMDINISEISRTEIIDIVSPESPISPRKRLWISWAGLLGIFLGVAVSLKLNSLS